MTLSCLFSSTRNDYYCILYYTILKREENSKAESRFQSLELTIRRFNHTCNFLFLLGRKSLKPMLILHFY